MDNLAIETMLARKAGMSYGKRKALQPRKDQKEKTIPDGWAKCECCGKLFKKTPNKRFCDIGCRSEAYKARANAIKENYRRQKNAAQEA